MDEILGRLILAGALLLALWAERSKPRRIWWR